MKSISRILKNQFEYFIRSVITIITFHQLILAQVSESGIPLSFSTPILGNIHTINMAPVDVVALLAEDEAEAQQDVPLPYRFGFPFEVDMGLNNAGTWTELPNGDRVWRLRIISPGAYSINLIYDDFWLPEGANFFIYNANHSMVIGAFTAANNKEHGKFSTGPVKGNISILEYYEPASVKGLGILHISRVVHAYRNLFDHERLLGFDDSGECNNNVNCPEGEPWCEEKRAVVMILLSGGVRLCSGAIVNNTEGDIIPYLLTAFHCIDSNQNGTLSSSEIQDAEDWIIMFNYESPNCSDIDGPTNQTVSGTTLKASYYYSDFALLRISTSPPISYQVHYAGWSRSTVTATSVVGIHHPASDIKKISFDSDSPSSWGNYWYVTDWDDGTTEGGSSGSPLFDQNHRIVGQDYAGNGYPPCDPKKGTYYGKFSVSWNGGGSSSTRLKDWLDPNNTGVTTLDGIGIPAPPTNLSISGCTGCMPTISWTASLCSEISYYKLYRRSSNTAFILIATPTGTSWIDSQITIENPGTDLYTYKVKAMNTDGLESEYSNLAYTEGSPFKPWKVLASKPIPDAYALGENYPNPFNPVTTIRYELPEDSFTKLRIYDIMGREIRTLVNGNEAAGYKNLLWDGKDYSGNPVSSGMYIYHISATSQESNLQFSQTRKMILMK